MHTPRRVQYGSAELGEIWYGRRLSIGRRRR
jgi:hypothetical protein